MITLNAEGDSSDTWIIQILHTVLLLKATAADDEDANGWLGCAIRLAHGAPAKPREAVELACDRADREIWQRSPRARGMVLSQHLLRCGEGLFVANRRCREQRHKLSMACMGKARHEPRGRLRSGRKALRAVCCSQHSKGLLQLLNLSTRREHEPVGIVPLFRQVCCGWADDQPHGEHQVAQALIGKVPSARR